ncbi:MAG: CDP-alcohol phosphatidyltransferase family protein [Acidobacteriota bacterium]
MASIYDLKPRFQALLRPTCRFLAARGVTPNQVTVAAIVLSVAAGALIAWEPTRRHGLLLVPVVLFARMALNAIDGMLAREHDLRSRLGALLNELGDVGADVALYLPFALVTGLSPALVVGVVVLSLIVEVAGLSALHVGASRRFDGPFGKSDRAFLFGLIGLLLGLGVSPGTWSMVLLALACVLAVLTSVQRCRRALMEGRNEAT